MLALPLLPLNLLSANLLPLQVVYYLLLKLVIIWEVYRNKNIVKPFQGIDVLFLDNIRIKYFHTYHLNFESWNLHSTLRKCSTLWKSVCILFFIFRMAKNFLTKFWKFEILKLWSRVHLYLKILNICASANHNHLLLLHTVHAFLDIRSWNLIWRCLLMNQVSQWFYQLGSRHFSLKSIFACKLLTTLLPNLLRQKFNFIACAEVEISSKKL